MTKWQSEASKTDLSPPLQGEGSPSPASPRYRILYIHNSADIYGASQSLRRLIISLDKSRFDPVILLPSDGPLADILRKYGKVIISPKISIITRRDYKLPNLPGFLIKIPISISFIAKLIRQEKIDLVHTNVGVIVSSPLSAFLTKTPHVWHMRDWFGEFKLVWPLFSRYVTTFSDAIIAISQSTASQFPSTPKIHTIFNGYDVNEFPPPAANVVAEFKRKYGLEGKFVIGCVGRIKLVRKGQETLVEAAKILEKYKDFRFLIVGSPFKDNLSHLDQLKELIQKLGVQDRVILTGDLRDPRPAYAAMDVSILPSAQPEPLGGVILESMCMKVPVIATNFGGPPEIITHGKTGLLFPPSDAQALAGCIERLYLHPEERHAMALAARQFVEMNISLEGMIRKFEMIYLDCLKARCRAN